MTKDGIIKIRAHHLLCMQGFQGYGYSRDFADHMKVVTDRFKKCPNTRIRVTTECDHICVACPNNAENKCTMDADADIRIRNMDMNVLRSAAIKPDSVGAYGEMIQRINSAFKNQKQLDDICGDCQWIDKCLWYLSVSKGEYRAK